MTDKNCVGCNKLMSYVSRARKYCSRQCAVKVNPPNSPSAGRGRFAANPNPHGLSTAAVGKVSELVTAIDLIEQGFHVYQAMRPDSPCDYVAIRFDGSTPTEVKLVETTTGWKTATGELRCPKMADKADKCHELAVVFDKAVTYLPGQAKPSMP